MGGGKEEGERLGKGEKGRFERVAEVRVNRLPNWVSGRVPNTEGGAEAVVQNGKGR